MNNNRPSTSTTDSFRAPVYKPVPEGVRIIPTYNNGWVANTLPAVRPVTPNRHLPEKTMSMKDPKLGVGKDTSVSHKLFTWKPPEPPTNDGPEVSSWDPCNLSFQSYVKLGPPAPSPRALVPGATSPRKNSTMKRRDPVEFGYISDVNFAATPSGMGYRAPPSERAVSAVVNFRHQQPPHSSGFKSNFNSGSLAEQFRQRWPAAPDGRSVSFNSFDDKAAHDKRFPHAPFYKGPSRASSRSGFNYSLKQLGPAAAPTALTSSTGAREIVPRAKLNEGPTNKMPQGRVSSVKLTVKNPSHNSGFMANFKQDRLAEAMQTQFPKDIKSITAGTHGNLSARDKAVPAIPYQRGPVHASHRSAYSRSMAPQRVIG